MPEYPETDYEIYDPQDGEVRIKAKSDGSKLVKNDSDQINEEIDKISNESVNVKEIPIKTLRDMESYVTQETWLFHDTIRRNIEVGKLGASDK